MFSRSCLSCQVLAGLQSSIDDISSGDMPHVHTAARDECSVTEHQYVVHRLGRRAMSDILRQSGNISSSIQRAHECQVYLGVFAFG